MVRRQNVQLRSGVQSDVYFDIKASFGRPDLLAAYGQGLADLLSADVTAVAGLGAGGHALATAVSLQAQLPLVIVRGQPRSHGLARQIEGYQPGSDDQVAVVDDVLTTGSSLERTVAILMTLTPARVTDFAVVVRRPPPDYLPYVKALLRAADFQ